MGVSPKTTIFLKECMADALLELMKEKQFSKITVKDISEAADVNRSTWFRHFNTKNEAITFKLIQLWNRWADNKDIKERHRYTLDNANTFFQFNYSIKDVLLKIYQSDLQSCVYEAFYQIMMPQYGINPIECYRARFYSYGLFGLLDEWIKRGFYEKPEEMAQLIKKII